jgi:hypothetical protein
MPAGADTAYVQLVDEIYRMLGREHEADLEREAQRRRLAAGVPRRWRLRFRISSLRLRPRTGWHRLAMRLRP